MINVTLVLWLTEYCTLQMAFCLGPQPGPVWRERWAAHQLPGIEEMEAEAEERRQLVEGAETTLLSFPEGKVREWGA